MAASGLLGGGLRFARNNTADKNTFSEETKVHPLNVLKFRGRLAGYDGQDAHREVTGAYFPRHRSMYISEIKDVQRLGEHNIKLIGIYPDDVYLKPDGDYFYTDDFTVGTRLELAQGKPAVIITDVDGSKLSYTTTGDARKHASDASGQPASPPAATWEKSSILAIGTLLFDAASAKRAAVRSTTIADVERQKRALFAIPNGQEAYALLKGMRGTITWDAFLTEACGVDNEYRTMCVVAAFKKVDYNKDFVVTLKEFAEFYCPKYHPLVLAGERSEHEILEKIITCFQRVVPTGLVSYAQFRDYYSGMYDGFRFFDFPSKKCEVVQKKISVKTVSCKLQYSKKLSKKNIK